MERGCFMLKETRPSVHLWHCFFLQLCFEGTAHNDVITITFHTQLARPQTVLISRGLQQGLLCNCAIMQQYWILYSISFPTITHLTISTRVWRNKLDRKKQIFWHVKAGQPQVELMWLILAAFHLVWQFLSLCMEHADWHDLLQWTSKPLSLCLALKITNILIIKQ